MPTQKKPNTNHNLENGFNEASLDLEVTVEEP